MMTCDEIIEELKVDASEKYKANVVVFGMSGVSKNTNTKKRCRLGVQFLIGFFLVFS